MMRYVIGFSFAALALWVLWATGAIMAVLVFLMVGAVPGTQLSVPPSAMFGILGLAMIAMFYWLNRLNLPAQVKELREAYHTEVIAQASPQKARRRSKSQKQPHPAQVFIIAIALRLAIFSRPLRSAVRACAVFFARTAHGFAKLAVAIAHLFIAMTKGIIRRAKPTVVMAVAWTKKQISYSVKGTMLSAHKWSSLKRKALASGAWALKRCNSALKRVKSLLIRPAR